jgi:hypothetical protein
MLDNPNAGPRSACRAQTGRHCKECRKASSWNRDTGQTFSVNDLCVLRAATVAYDPAAYRQTLQAVKALVGTDSASNSPGNRGITGSIPTNVDSSGVRGKIEMTWAGPN